MSARTPDPAALLAELAASPDLARLAAGSLRVSTPGAWTPPILVSHLARVEVDVWQARLRQMAAEVNPRWEWWEPDHIDWPAEYGRRSLDEALADFAARRAETVAYLRALPTAGWARTGTHAVFGVLDVAGLAREMLKHDREHLGPPTAS